MKKHLVGAILLASSVSAGAFGGGVNPEWSIARQWDEEILQAIRLSTPRPPVHARNLYHVSSAMYDGWAAYDSTARGVYFIEKHTARDVEAARHETISYAAYRILKARYVTGNGPNIAAIQAAFDALFLELGYNKNFTTTVGDTPAAIGNRIASVILAAGLADGSNEQGNYAATNGYVPSNLAMPFKIPGCIMQNANRWQPLAFDFLVLQNGEIIGAAIQAALCPHWNSVKPFGMNSLVRSTTNNLYYDQGPPPTLGQAAHIADAVDMIAKSAVMDPQLDTMIDISPGVFHNSPLGSYEQPGHGLNPVTGEPYAPNLVRLADYARIIAEIWADGPDSETPPGHWHVVANETSDHPQIEYKIGGVGDSVDRLEWDVKLYMGLSGADHDAAITAWGMKGFYDSARPISFVRYVGELGQSTDPELPGYHPAGLPLIPDLIEIITEEDVQPGGRFEDFPEIIYDPSLGEPIGIETHVGKLAIRSWLGGFSAGTTTGATATGPVPGHVYRGKGGTWKIGSFYTDVDDSPGALNPLQTLPRAIQISEIRVDQPGNDFDEYFELAGPPGASLNGLTYIVIGDEVQTSVPDSQGHIQSVISLDGHSLDRNGMFVVGKTNFSLGTANINTHFAFKEIGNCTHMLVSNFTGYNGQELDFIDDGILDITPWTSVVDAIGLRRKSGPVGIYATASLGPDQSPNQLYGSGWVQADRWMTYQASNFVTPPFPGYTSGHSTFSRAAAEFMAAFTGSEYFPGGFAELVIPANFLKFEDGPEQDVHLQWASYYDAADEAGISRIWGGIHPRADDLPGRVSGSFIGKRVALRAFALFEGLASSPDVNADGTVDAADLAILLGAWGGGSASGGDLDGNGTVDAADLAILLGAWGS
ncbi:MAG: hypothetical protein SGJ11_09240 [Phycisphaerae bacterium]|nr:hypothetical protein [Phycisphaerae bacterium]